MRRFFDHLNWHNPLVGTSITDHLIVAFLTVTTLLSILLRIEEVRVTPHAWIRILSGAIALGVMLSVRYLGWIRAATIALTIEAIAGAVTLTTVDIPFIQKHQYDIARAMIDVWENTGHRTPRVLYLHDSLTIPGQELVTLAQLPISQIQNTNCATFWTDTRVLGTDKNWVWARNLQPLHDRCVQMKTRETTQEHEQSGVALSKPQNTNSP